jgi:two-component system LytT family sensor kinase
MIVSAAWTIPALLGAVNEVAQRQLSGSAPPPLAEIIFVVADWLIYGGLTPAVFAAAQRWPIGVRRLARHVAVHLVLSIVFCAAWAAGGAVLRSFLMPEALSGGFQMHLVSWSLYTMPFGVAVYLSVVGVQHAIRYFSDAQNEALRSARLSEQLAAAQLSALQAQLNPHFLFNTLNAIAVLVRDGDRTRSAELVEHLSDVLRRTLGRNRHHEGPLGEELELVRHYLAIERMRFSDRLDVVIDVDATLATALVPTLAVQHLVENAVRHGIAGRSEASTVTVTARRDADVLEIAVRDDGVGVKGDAPLVAGHGLDNTRARLRALYGGQASLVVSPGPTRGTVAVLRLPFREAPLRQDDDDR